MPFQGPCNCSFLSWASTSSGGPHSSPITGQYSCCTISSPLSAGPSQARPPSVSVDTFNLRLGEHFSQMQRPLPCARTSARPFPSPGWSQSCPGFPKCQGTLAGSQSCFLDAPCGDRYGAYLSLKTLCKNSSSFPTSRPSASPCRTAGGARVSFPGPGAAPRPPGWC